VYSTVNFLTSWSILDNSDSALHHPRFSLVPQS
jgi:hypothetical protein